MAEITDFEAAARHRKVEHLKAVIRNLSIPITADDVAGWRETEWALATSIANATTGVHHDLPSDRTRQLVVEDLREAERLAAMSDDDLFGSLS